MKNKKTLLFLALLFTVVLSLSYIFFRIQTSDSILEAAINRSRIEFKNTAQIPFDESLLLKINDGPPDSPKVILGFDFLCANCIQVAQELLDNNQAQNQTVYVALYPLSKSCNSKIKVKGQMLSCELAKSLICQYKKNKENLRANFLNLVKFSKDIDQSHLDLLGESAKLQSILNLNSNEFKTCQSDEGVNLILEKMINELAEANFQTLPAIFINSRPYRGLLDRDSLKQAMLDAAK